MARFGRGRSIEDQAGRIVAANTRLGAAKHGDRSGMIHSIRTRDAYVQALERAGKWLEARYGITRLADITRDQAMSYLAERAQGVGQKQLDVDRRALELVGRVNGAAMAGASLERIRSERAEALTGRAYTRDQVQAIAARQSARNALATEIARAAGLRAHELHTLRPAGERPPSGHREWSPERFTGREGVRYTVQGKGGLVREVSLPRDLADRLEAVRRPDPVEILDRGVRYVSHYDVGGGNAWSRSFGAASERALGWSTGAHGLRHSYAQERMAELQSSGLAYTRALETVSQELGHFRADITRAYLR